MIQAFTYTLPEDRIAQRPVRPFHDAKLLVTRRENALLLDSTFWKLPEFLRPDDVLVLNESKVINARLRGAVRDVAVEMLLTREAKPGCWQAIGRPLRKLKPGDEIIFPENLRAVYRERVSEREILLEFSAPEPILDVIERVGIPPIPPYIRHGDGDTQDKSDYQTCFAKEKGSIAAPTASLHFTPELLEKIKAAGVQLEFVTLHVGPASFLPLESEGQRPGEEYFRISEMTWTRLQQAKAAGRRILPVGTTTMRALESAAGNPEFRPETLLSTDLFIQPGFTCKMASGLITNFHQPGTTHMLLVQALLGKDLLAASYRHALENQYRFLSYGDGMFLC